MLREFMLLNDLQPADVIIAKKRGWYIWDHYIVYVGMKWGKMHFIANDAKGGVRLFDEEEITQLIVSFEPTQIRRFRGSFWEREQALKRAEGELGKHYNLFTFNCEHLANYIQYGKRESVQVDRWLTAAFVLVVLWVAGGGLNSK